MPQARNIRARLLSAYHGTGRGGKLFRIAEALEVPPKDLLNF